MTTKISGQSFRKVVMTMTGNIGSIGIISIETLTSTMIATQDPSFLRTVMRMGNARSIGIIGAEKVKSTMIKTQDPSLRGTVMMRMENVRSTSITNAEKVKSTMIKIQDPSFRRTVTMRMVSGEDRSTSDVVVRRMDLQKYTCGPQLLLSLEISMSVIASQSDDQRGTVISLTIMRLLSLLQQDMTKTPSQGRKRSQEASSGASSVANHRRACQRLPVNLSLGTHASKMTMMTRIESIEERNTAAQPMAPTMMTILAQLNLANGEKSEKAAKAETIQVWTPDTKLPRNTASQI